MNMNAKIAALAIVAIGTIFATPALAEVRALFNTIEYLSNDLGALPKWKTVMSKVTKEKKAYAACAGEGRRCSSEA